MTESTLPRVVVLLTSYNGQRWIEQQIESILNQIGVQLRIEIADDVSTDGTVELIRSFRASDKRIRLVVRETPSGSAGANFRQLFRDVEVSDADFVALSDQDDVWLPDKLRAGVERLKSEGSAGYSCAVRSFWKDGRESLHAQATGITEADFLFEGAGQGCTFVMRREFFDEVRAFCIVQRPLTEALHYHDWLIYLLARAWQYQWSFDAQPYIRYRQHGGNEIGARGSVIAYWRRLELIRSGWYRRQISAAIDIHRAAIAPASQPEVFARLRIFPRGLAAQLHSAGYVIRHARRRLVDRLALALAATLGWI